MALAFGFELVTALARGNSGSKVLRPAWTGFAHNLPNPPSLTARGDPLQALERAWDLGHNPGYEVMALSVTLFFYGSRANRAGSTISAQTDERINPLGKKSSPGRTQCSN